MILLLEKYFHNTIKMKQKVIYTIIFFIFFGIASFFYGEEYIRFLDEKNENKQIPQVIQNEENSFSFDSLESIEKVRFFATPDLNFLDFLVEKINASEKRVYINVYIFTEKRLKSSLIDAKKRWVDVRVVLEKNVYNAPFLNTNTFDELKEAWIDIVWSNSSNYVFNHAKFALFDDEFLLWTWNFSYTTFKTNKDFFILTADPKYVVLWEQFFNNNFIWDKKYISHPNILQSPYSSRYKFEYIIKNAKKSLHMYIPYLSDTNLITLLQEKSAEVDIFIITNASKNNTTLEVLEKKWIKVYYSKKEIHAKSILVDDLYLYIGSINFSENSIDNNMELWLLLKETEIITPYKEVFVNDFYK